MIKPSSDENVSLAVINGNYDILDTEVASRVKKTDVVNNVTSTGTNVPLSANMGKKLQDEKVAISSIVNNLTSTATDAPLSAAQGKALSDTIATLSTLIDRFIKSDVYPTDNTDLNNIKENGFRCINSTAPHNPIAQVGYLLTVRYNVARVFQIFLNYNYTGMRSWDGSTWSAWQKLVTADDIISETISFTTNQDANPAITVTVTKSGYTPIMANVEFTGNNHAFVYYCQIKNDTQVFLQFHGDENQTIGPLTGILRVVYKRN